MHIGRKEALAKTLNNLALSKNDQNVRHIFLIEDASFSEQAELYRVAEQAASNQDVSMIPAPEKGMVEFFLDNLKNTMKNLDVTQAKQLELEDSVTTLHDREVAEEYMEYEFNWTRRRAGRFIVDHNIRNLRELMDRPELLGSFEREKLCKLRRLC